MEMLGNLQKATEGKQYQEKPKISEWMTLREA